MEILNDPAIWLKKLFIDSGLNLSLSAFLSTLILALVVLVFAWLSNLSAKIIINKAVKIIAKRTGTKWDHVFVENKVFTRLSHFFPVVIIWLTAGWIFKSFPTGLIIVHKLAYVYIVIIGTVVLNSLFSTKT